MTTYVEAERIWRMQVSVAIVTLLGHSVTSNVGKQKRSESDKVSVRINIESIETTQSVGVWAEPRPPKYYTGLAREK